MTQICRVIFTSVLDHICKTENQRRDQLAGSVNVQEGQPMDEADIIINAIKETDKTKDFTDNCESTSLSRIKVNLELQNMNSFYF